MKNLIKVIFLSLLLGFISSCKENGEGPLLGAEVPVKYFKGIEVNVSGQVVVEYGTEQKVYIEAQQNVINALSTKLEKDIWVIKLNTPISNYDLKIHIITPEIKKCDINGSANVTLSGPHSSDGKFHSDISGSGSLNVSGMNALHKEIHLNVSGSGNVSFTGIETKDLSTNISGSANILFNGLVSNYFARVSGSGNVSDFNLMAQEVDVESSGSGSMSFTCNAKLKAKVSGSAVIQYKGNPTSINTEVNDSGSIVNVK